MNTPRFSPSGPPLNVSVLRQAQYFTSNAAAAPVAVTGGVTQLLVQDNGTAAIVLTLDNPDPELYYQADFRFLWNTAANTPSIDPMAVQYSVDGGATWTTEPKSQISGRTWPGTGPFTVDQEFKTGPLKGSALGVLSTTTTLKVRMSITIGSNWSLWAQRSGSLQELSP